MKFFWLFFLFFMASCQTIDRTKKAQYNIKQKTFFSSCLGGDGYGSLEIAVSGEQKFRGEFEWLSSVKQPYVVNILSPFGENLLKLEGHNKGKHLSLSNSYARKLPLSVGKDGFLTYANHWVGLKPEEIPCFLKGKIPEQWLKNKKAYYLNLEQTKYYLEEKDRWIYLDFLKDKVCLDIHWNVFWWLRRTNLKMCYAKKSSEENTFLLDGKYSLKTKVIE